MSAVATLEPRRSLLVEIAADYGMEAKAFADTLKATVVPANTSDGEFAAFLLVARQYKLNPITKEIFAFPKRGGGIQPVVSVDGWSNLINSHPQCDGVEFVDALDDKGDLVSITCQIYRKDRSRPTTATEYMDECRRATDTWKQWPRRMLRHKALIQAARYAFGFAGIVDQDEAERMPDTTPSRLAPPPAPPPAAVTRAPEPEPEAPTPAVAGNISAHWLDYFDMQKGELAASTTAHSIQAVTDTVLDTIAGARERGELSETDAECLRDTWEGIAT